MSVKLVVMRSGQQIIADIKEMVVEGKAVGYYLTKPCAIEMANRNEEEVLLNNSKTAFDVSLYPWIPLAKGEQVPIALDWVVTLVDPVDMLMEMYQTNVIDSTKPWGEGLNHPEKECKTCR
jgi:hypothetical protein